MATRKILILIRQRLLKGLLTIFPAVFTVWAVVVTVRFVDNLFQPLFEKFLGATLPGFGLALTVILLYLVGGLITHRIVENMVSLGEYLIQKIPVAGPIYSTVRQTIEVFQGNLDKGNFSRVVLVQFPRVGSWTVAFVTRSTEIDGRPHLCVFVPTSPNPTGGYVIFVPEDETKPSSLKMDQALRFIMSGGAVPGGEIALQGAK